MSDARISLAMEPELLEEFDGWLNRRGSSNRSEAIRDLIREALARDASQEDEERVGTLTLVYDHTQRNLAHHMIEHGHTHDGTVLATLHIHLDHAMCLEVMALRGRTGELRHFADHLIAMKGVLHGELTLSRPDFKR